MRRAVPYDAFPMLYVPAPSGNLLHDPDGDMTPLDDYGYVPDHKRERLLRDLEVETHCTESVLQGLVTSSHPVKEQIVDFWVSWWRRHNSEALRALEALPCRKRIRNDDSNMAWLIDMVLEYASLRHRVTLVMGRSIYRQYEASVSLIHPERPLPNPGTTGIGMPIGSNTRVIMNLSLDCYAPGVVYVVNEENVFRAQSPVSFETTRDFAKCETVTRFTESYRYVCGDDPGFKIAVRQGG